MKRGEPIGDVGATEEDSEVVPDEFAATVGENRQTSCEARRYYWLLLAEGHLSRSLFASTLRVIAALPLPDGTSQERHPNRTLPSLSSGDRC